MTKTAVADIVIFGGGIAGLWLLNRLRKSGLSAILFDSGAIGGGQTHKSQGIIHGGLKYALQGMLSKDATVLADIPQIWRDCLQGKGEIDLSGVPVLSEKQYLWAPSKFTSKLTGFFASTTLTSKVKSLARAEYPAIFQHPAFKGEVSSLDEMVLDVPSLMRELVKENQDALFKVEPLSEDSLRFDSNGKLISATVYFSGMPVEVSAQQFIFTAGSGNELIIKKLKTSELAMQRRPLHMVLAKVPFDYPLYAHCLGLGARPRITITTHHAQDGRTIWYLGGQIAEEGVHLNGDEQAKVAATELTSLFPWLNFRNTEYATFKVDRAEPRTKGLLKPESCYFKNIANVVIAWPTKLALAPKLAGDILQYFEQLALTPQAFDARELRTWPMPPIALPVWEDMFCKNVA